MSRYSIKIFLVIAVPFFFSNCSENIVESVKSIDEDIIPIGVEATFQDIQKNIFNNSCALSGCHINGVITPDLSNNAYLKIKSVASSNGINYIEPNNPDQSYLLQKVLGSNEISGSRMPLNSSPLAQEQINSLIEWINDGALNN